MRLRCSAARTISRARGCSERDSSAAPYASKSSLPETLRRSRGQQDVCDSWLPRRQRARLVEYHGANGGHVLEIGSPLEEDALAGRVGNRREDRCRSRNDERARRCHHEHDHRPVERRAQLVPECEPRHEDHQCNEDEDDPGIHGLGPLEKALRARLVRLRRLHHPDNAGERGVVGQAGDLELDRSGPVQGAGIGGLARSLVGGRATPR